MFSAGGHPISAEQQHLLCLGRVPLPSRKMVQRKRLRERISDPLKAFFRDPDSRWFLVQGIPGSGKTHLISQLLWIEPSFCLGQFDRIIWVADRSAMCLDGLMALAIDTFLLSKICLENQTFDRQILEEGPVRDGILASEPEQIENNHQKGDQQDCWKVEQIKWLGEQLKRTMRQSNMRVLVVIDGVLTDATVRFFDTFVPEENCKLLATSTSREIFDVINTTVFGTFCMDEHDDVLSCEELQWMANLFGMRETISHEICKQILMCTGGNLALLEKLFTLSGGELSILTTILQNFSKSPLSTFSCHSAYPFHNLETPIQMCLKMVDDERLPFTERLPSKFTFCTVVEPFIWTPFLIFSLVWPLDQCNETEEMMQEHAKRQLRRLVLNSLLDKKTRRTANSVVDDCYCYRIHPIVHSFLLHNILHSYTNFRVSCQALLLNLREKQQKIPIYANYLNKNEERLQNMEKMVDGMQGKLNGRAKKQVHNVAAAETGFGWFFNWPFW